MTDKKGISKTKLKVNEIMKQARESLKILQTLEKETIARAKTLVKLPDLKSRRRLTNERILSGLEKIGVATASQVRALDSKIEKLEGLMTARKAGAKSNRSKRASSS